MKHKSRGHYNSTRIGMGCVRALTMMALYSFIVANGAAFATTFRVGAGRTYTLPSQVVALVRDGDTVDIDAGSYVDCTTWTRNNLLLRGVGGYAHLHDKSCGGKAIWIIQGNNATVEQIEFSGATVVDNNGAGIRQEGANLTVRRCYFHDNEDGVLAGANPNSAILIEHSEFASNGYGDGYSHNMYIGHIASFTVQYCYIHHAQVGHNVKSRADRTFILYNRISDEATGTASRDIDLPNGGLAVVLGNVIQHGPNTENSNTCGYGLEGLSNPIRNLYIVANTFVNARSSGSFVQIPATGTDTLRMANNIFAGAGTIFAGTASTLDTLCNLRVATPALAGLRDPAIYDYHLTAGGSPAIDAGTDPGNAGSISLLPVYEYVHPADITPRAIRGRLDIGAYEYDSGTRVEEDRSDIAENMRLEQNYPNPFSESTTIRLRMTDEKLQSRTRTGMTEARSGTAIPPASSCLRLLDFDEQAGLWRAGCNPGTGLRLKSTLSLKVYDLFGREVLDLSDAAGLQTTIELHSTQLPGPGFYFCRLTSPRGSQSKTMLFLR